MTAFIFRRLQTLRSLGTRALRLLTASAVGVAAAPSLAPPTAAQAPPDLPWQSPPDPIDRWLDRPVRPSLSWSSDGRWLVEADLRGWRSLADLAQPVEALAGQRLDPSTFGPPAPLGIERLRVIDRAAPPARRAPVEVALPEGSRTVYWRWSREDDRIALVLLPPSGEGYELWVLELETGQARPLTGPILNATYGNPCDWLPGDAGLVCKVRPDNPPPLPDPEAIAAGPAVQESAGRMAAARTYANLLQNPRDEQRFEHYFTSAVERIALDGRRSPLLPPALVDEVTPSPDGAFLLVKTLRRPFSYQVPLSRFPQRLEVFDLQGRSVYRVADLPLADDIPLTFNSVRAGRRRVGWRSDRPAALYWFEALDGGDAGRPADVRDALVQLPAPFDGDPQRLGTFKLRLYSILWGDGDTALASESWYDTRTVRTWRLRPDRPDAPPEVIFDRNYQDAYNDPGSPVLRHNEYGRSVLRLTPDGRSLYLSGRGASPDGVYPFLDRHDLETGETERLWQARDPYYETVLDLFDDRGETFITRRESPTDPPNYRWYDGGEATPLTAYPDPIPEFADVRRETLRYERADGLPLSADLYLPPGYDRDRDGPLPVLFWVYPDEYVDRQTAGQVIQAKNAFRRPGRWTSPLYLLSQGYAVLYDPSLPVIGEGGAEPNDTYVAQIVAGAEAAAETLVERGIADRDRLWVWGHSYGAFTTANLLAHSDLFRAGVGSSGAYNRTLTPFGFQGEQRSFWEAPEVYLNLSPFAAADRIRNPLLLIHGEDDSNAGTYPLQSERFYDALQGLGGTARLVLLPYEGHGYRSREAVGHVLWEILQWGDRHVKPAPTPEVNSEEANSEEANAEAVTSEAANSENIATDREP